MILKEPNEKSLILDAIFKLNQIKRKCDLIGYHEALNMAIEALQKQMPMRPIITGGYAECPKCHADVNSTMWYCAGTYYDMGCGQQLDWSDEE